MDHVQLHGNEAPIIAGNYSKININYGTMIIGSHDMVGNSINQQLAKEIERLQRRVDELEARCAALTDKLLQYV